MYPETLATGHRAIWSLPQQQRTTKLVLIFHDAGSTPETVAEHYFCHLPTETTGLALQAGFNAAFGHNWFTSQDHQNPNFPELLSAATESLMLLTTTNTPLLHQHPGHRHWPGAALATTLLKYAPVFSGVIGLNGYVIDNPMLAA